GTGAEVPGAATMISETNVPQAGAMGQQSGLPGAFVMNGAAAGLPATTLMGPGNGLSVAGQGSQTSGQARPAATTAQAAAGGAISPMALPRTGDGGLLGRAETSPRNLRFMEDALLLLRILLIFGGAGAYLFIRKL